jgi:hypothetical protein
MTAVVGRVAAASAAVAELAACSLAGCSDETLLDVKDCGSWRRCGLILGALRGGTAGPCWAHDGLWITWVGWRRFWLGFWCMSGLGLVAARECLGRRVPAGDPGWVRVVAARSAGFAGELRRVSAVLSGCAGVPGWRGVARQEFARSVSVTTPQLGRVAGRYEGYAAALIGYAVVLDRVQPRLVWLRGQLVAGVAEQAATAERAGAGSPAAAVWHPVSSVGAADSGGDGRLRSWAAEFDGLWNEWDRALRRCRHDVGAAGRVEADRHGWSAVGHGAVQLLGSVTDPVLGFAEHPDLASLSHALGGLATDLTVLGAVLLVVCPPAAGVCFTAAAVVSAAKLGTDVVRAGRGDPGVGLKTLGADAIAALPGSKAVTAGEDSARAVTTIENLAEHQRTTRLVPGGGLGAHEAINRDPRMGHTLLKHVALSKGQLKARLKADPRLKVSSAFYDRAIAESSISDVIAENQVSVDTWLKTSKRTLVLKGRATAPVGTSIWKGDKQMDVSGLVVVLRRDHPTWAGYRIHTGFPQP